MRPEWLPLREPRTVSVVNCAGWTPGKRICERGDASGVPGNGIAVAALVGGPPPCPRAGADRPRAAKATTAGTAASRARMASIATVRRNCVDTTSPIG